MTVASFALAAMLGLAADAGPSELVARLGSSSFADREGAASALRRLGRSALPALRDARDSRDPEIRARASALVGEIGAASALEPTPVRLDFRDRPLSEVADAIGRAAGVTLAPGPESAMSRPPGSRPAWPDRRVTLEAPDPVPFWEAIGRLCRAGGLRRAYPLGDYGPDEPFHRLILVPGESSAPAVDAGPVRVELLRVHRGADLDLAPGLYGDGRGMNFGVPRTGPGVDRVRRSDCFAELLVSVEPRLRIVGEAPLERLEAVDEAGRSILKGPTPEEQADRLQMLQANPHLDPQRHPGLRFGSGGSRSSPTRLRRVPLADSAPAGGRLARLRGVVAVAVMARQADPPALPLADAKGQTVAKDGVRLTVHEAKVKPGHFDGEIELTLEIDDDGETLKIQGPGVAPLDIRRPIDLLQRQLEILDEADRALEWSFLRPPKQGIRGRMRLSVRPRESGERVEFSKLRVRVFAIVGAAIEVPFSFADVPMPGPTALEEARP